MRAYTPDPRQSHRVTVEYTTRSIPEPFNPRHKLTTGQDAAGHHQICGTVPEDTRTPAHPEPKITAPPGRTKATVRCAEATASALISLPVTESPSEAACRANRPLPTVQVPASAEQPRTHCALHTSPQQPSVFVWKKLCGRRCRVRSFTCIGRV